MNAFQKKIDTWKMSLETAAEIQAVNEQVDQLEMELYCDYEPTKGPYPNFWQRLEKWVDSAKTQTNQQNLCRLMQHIFFVGPRELDSLYRVAFNSHVARWLVEKKDIRLDDPAAPQKLKEAVKHTWFCPLTDSMRINAFYHLNHLSGRDYRPDWLSLQNFAESHKVDAYIASEQIESLVLLEDFVGSGIQVDPAVNFVGSLPSKTPALILPLVVCPTGVKAGIEWERQYANVTCRSVLALNQRDFLTAIPQAEEPAEFADFRQLAVNTFDDVLGGETEIEAKVYSPFGFDGTGGLIVLATNCPDNTLPLIHHSSRTWSALFPRASRI
jgi:hypothetical protein